MFCALPYIDSSALFSGSLYRQAGPLGNTYFISGRQMLDDYGSQLSLPALLWGCAAFGIAL
jgi:hypothetical protein